MLADGQAGRQSIMDFSEDMENYWDKGV